MKEKRFPDLKWCDSNGNTLIHEEIVNGDINVIVALLENGVPVAAQNSSGDTAAHLLLTYGINT